MYIITEWKRYKRWVWFGHGLGWRSYDINSHYLLCLNLMSIFEVWRLSAPHLRSGLTFGSTSFRHLGTLPSFGYVEDLCSPISLGCP
jgi:hypothetical protein